MIWVQLSILLLMILIGAHLKGIGLGVMGMAGLLVFVLFFRMRPAEPPVDVMLIILSIVTTAAALQAAGGLDYLVGIAEKIIRSKPSKITLVAPLTVYFLCLFAGTAHIVYSLLPIIADVSAKKRIRPERPLSISVVASHLALTGSPMSAATALLATMLGYPGAALDIMKICIPASLVAICVGALSVWKMGKDLDNDPVFIERLKVPDFKNWLESVHPENVRVIRKGAKTAVLIFSAAILMVVLLGAFPQLVPHTKPGAPNFAVNADGTLKMSTLIEIITLSAAGIILLVTKTTTTEVIRASLFTSMASAVVSVFGVVWMSATFMANNEAVIKTAMGTILQSYPWTFALAVFTMGIFMFSQAATTKAMMPLGLSLGLTHPVLIAIFPAVNSDFILPGYPTLLAAIQFDRTGSTRIGNYVLNHSFIRPGIIVIGVTIALGFLLTKLLF